MRPRQPVSKRSEKIEIFPPRLLLLDELGEYTKQQKKHEPTHIYQRPTLSSSLYFQFTHLVLCPFTFFSLKNKKQKTKNKKQKTKIKNEITVKQNLKYYNNDNDTDTDKRQTTNDKRRYNAQTKPSCSKRHQQPNTAAATTTNMTLIFCPHTHMP